MNQTESSTCISITFLWLAVFLIIINNHTNTQENNIPPIDLLKQINDVIKAYKSLGLAGNLLLVLIIITIEIKLYQKHAYLPMICIAMITIGVVMWKFDGFDMRLMFPVFRGTNMTGH